MKRRWWKSAISLVVVLTLALGSAAIFVGTPRVLLIRIATTPFASKIINKLLQYSLPPNDAACLAKLSELEVEFERQSDFSVAEGCSVENSVRLARVGRIKIDNAPLLTCRMATQLHEFEEERLQPIARRIFGAEVTRLNHLGTYSCRSMRQFKGILSQHAFANAIDISQFVLADGQSISVQRDWKSPVAKSRFLREVSSAACNTFRVSVSPDGDANHWNHLHWDMGFYESCG
ncbi:MAG: extensin family protein [Gammaproteobacteria bacterium]|nr:extensin family protein [Gammaproteobacteria bacterium]